MGRRSGSPDAREITAEIVRRATAGQHAEGPDGDQVRMYVVRMGDPPTAAEQLQLLAARLLGCPVAIMPRKCATMEDWQERYGHPRKIVTIDAPPD